MRRMGTMICTLALVAGLLVVGDGEAKLLYEETLTIILDDGTHVMLVLDDYGTKPAQRTGPSPQLRQAKFDYLKKVQQAKEKYWMPYQMAGAAAASAAQKGVLDQMAAQQGALAPQLAAKRNHAQARLLWPIQVGAEKRYYYLPPPPRVAIDSEGRPQFLLMKFTSDRSAEEGGVAGGILHFLCEYGLTPEQEAELKAKLAREVKGAKLMGAVQMLPGEGESTFRIISATMSEGGFAESVVASGKAPLLPGQKVAAAARLDPAGTVLIEESLKRPTSDISVEFDLAYTAFLPAFDGRITFDWERFKSHTDEWKMEYSKKKSCKWWIFGCKTSYSTTEMRELYDFLCESEVIRVEWTETMVDERLEAIRQAFFRFMETSFFERTAAGFSEDDDEEDLGEGMLTPEERGSSSEFNRFVAKSEEAFTNKTISMKVTLPVKVQYVVVGNISGSWYRAAQQEYPELFAEVNVDDPFFEQRRVAFTLDLDAIEIFDEAINLVTVEVRKDRPSGRDFQTSFTLTKAEVGANGPTRMVSYAKMRDDSPEVFDYRVRWSLRGGVEWPSDPSWEKGQWAGVTLMPPVVPLNVEAEADLDQLGELEFTRATVEVRYTQFGKQVTDTRSLQLSVNKGEPITSLLIFRDRDRSKWEYRVNLYHKDLGREQGRWTAGGDDGYVYCSIPDKLRLEIEGRSKVSDALGVD